MAQQEESDQEPFMNPPAGNEEIIETEVIDITDPEEKYEELSDKTDMETSPRSSGRSAETIKDHERSLYGQ